MVLLHGTVFLLIHLITKVSDESGLKSRFNAIFECTYR